MSTFSYNYLKSFIQNNNLYYLYKDLHSDFIKKINNTDKKIQLDNLITNQNEFPIIGFHSTDWDSFQSITVNGFNASSGNRWGREEDDPVVALFTIFFQENYESINNRDFITYNPNATVSISNGILRVYRKLYYKYIETNKDETDIGAEQVLKNHENLNFPLIVSCFQGVKNGKITISGSWISVYSKDSIDIIGYYKITVEKSKELYEYLDNKTKNTEINTSYYAKYFDYSFEWYESKSVSITADTVVSNKYVMIPNVIDTVVCEKDICDYPFKIDIIENKVYLRINEQKTVNMKQSELRKDEKRTTYKKHQSLLKEQELTKESNIAKNRKSRLNQLSRRQKNKSNLQSKKNKSLSLSKKSRVDDTYRKQFATI